MEPEKRPRTDKQFSVIDGLEQIASKAPDLGKWMFSAYFDLGDLCCLAAASSCLRAFFEKKGCIEAGRARLLELIQAQKAAEEMAQGEGNYTPEYDRLMDDSQACSRKIDRVVDGIARCENAEVIHEAWTPPLSQEWRSASLLSRAAKQKRVEFVKHVISERTGTSVSRSTATHLLSLAIETGCVELAGFLLAATGAEPAGVNPRAVVGAATNEDEAMIKFLLENGHIEPDMWDNLPLRAACGAGRTEAVKLLCADPRVDVTAIDNECLRAAAECGHADVVRFLLTLKEVSPAAVGNMAYGLAKKNGHKEIVALLEDDPRVGPDCIEDWELQYAIQNAGDPGSGAARKALEMITSGKYDPSAHDNAALVIAAELCGNEIVAELLKDPRVNPRDRHSLAFKTAVKTDNGGAVRAFLADGRIDPTADDNWAIKWSCRFEECRVLWRLVGNWEVQKSVDAEELLKEAIFRDNESAQGLIVEEFAESLDYDSIPEDFREEYSLAMDNEWEADERPGLDWGENWEGYA